MCVGGAQAASAGGGRTLYDPTAGTGGLLSSGMEYVHELNPRAIIRKPYIFRFHDDNCLLIVNPLLRYNTDNV